jgi:thymidylate synthase (FAD)
MEIHKPEISLLAVTPRAEKLIEEAGRTCYLSFDKMDDTSEQNFIRRCIRSGHHSILEPASASFRIRGASRAFTHQLVRHRVASFSQQSQRYVSEEEFNFVVPPDIAANPAALTVFRDFMESARRAYVKLREAGVKKEDARFVLPNALESEIVFSANFRELRHVFALRCARGAQWEIRGVCLEMLRVMRKEAPSVFGDFIIDEESRTAKSELV